MKLNSSSVGSVDASSHTLGCSRRRLALELAAGVAILFLVYLAAAIRIASFHAVWSPDCGARLIQVESILRHWPHWWVSYPAHALDPLHQNSPLYFYEFQHGSHIYVFYSFLFALISAIGFHFFGYVGLAILPMFSGIVASLAVYGLARRLRMRYPLAPMLIFGLVTPMALYSVVFWDHAVTTCVAVVSLYLAVTAVTSRRPWLWFAAGAALGAGLWIHEILIPCLPALIAAAWWTRRYHRWLVSAGLALTGFALLTLPLAIANQFFYGTPFGPHLSNNHLGSTGAIFGFLGHVNWWGPGALYTLFAWGDSNPGYTWQLRQWLNNPSPELRFEIHASYWLAAPVLLWIVLAVSGMWLRRYPITFRNLRIAIPGWPFALIAFAGLIADGGWVYTHADWPHSLFYACPLLAIAFGAFGGFRSASAQNPGSETNGKPDQRSSSVTLRRRAAAATANAETDSHPTSVVGPEPVSLAGMIAVATLVYTLAALLNPALGGSEWGSRYLLITTPALSLFAWAAAEKLLPKPGLSGGWLPGARPLLIGMALILATSVALQIHGFGVVSMMHRSNHQIAAAIERSPDRVIVTDVWWAPLDAAAVFQQKLIVYAGIDIAGGPIHPMPPLAQRMKAAGYRTYTLVGYSPWDLSNFTRPYGYLPISGTYQALPFGLAMARYGML
ncbi:MAG TPA: hypothetical protein VFJ58_19740 [Armatimonadota bacterium]|nr:hypothetical protein [Armatimonadota bacterium]